MATNNLIYGLIDPDTRLVRYVGKSTKGMQRPRAHAFPSLLKQDRYKDRWIKTLLARGQMYDIVVLEETALDRLAAAERWWVAFGHACGWPLTNLTAGGDGTFGWTPSDELRQRWSHSHKGRRPSAETRKRMAAAHTGRPATIGFAGRKHSPETIARMAESHRRRWARKKKGE